MVWFIFDWREGLSLAEVVRICSGFCLLGHSVLNLGYWWKGLRLAGVVKMGFVWWGIRFWICDIGGRVWFCQTYLFWIGIKFGKLFSCETSWVVIRNWISEEGEPFMAHWSVSLCAYGQVHSMGCDWLLVCEWRYFCIAAI